MVPTGVQVQMQKLEFERRIQCFDEVALGYRDEEALEESLRCLQCKTPKCVEGCPVGVDIPRFIKLLKEDNIKKSVASIRSSNSLPKICGRVCPQENQCMGKCVLGNKGEPINIGGLERYIADKDREKIFNPKLNNFKNNKSRKVAIVGSGPAGLTAAAELAKKGYNVTIFEALHIPGGVLTYGIPEFRLPKKIVEEEINFLINIGVKIETNIIVGKSLTISELLETGYESVFIGTGAGLPTFLGIPGENLVGIYSANEFLIRVNLMKAFDFPKYNTPAKVGKKVIVIGGGNVAIDAARCAIRLGGKVTVIYRRTREYMPARHEELVNAEQEGVRFVFCASPSKFLGNKESSIKRVECVRVKLGDIDESGRRKPILLEGNIFNLKADTVIVAIGQKPNLLAIKGEKNINITNRGTIKIDPVTGRTSRPEVFAAGDIATGNATVISAMAGGKKAANAIHEFLTTKQ